MGLTSPSPTCRDEDVASLAPIRRQAEDAGVVIPMMVTYTDFTHPDPARRAARPYQLRARIEAATHLGVGYLRVTAGQKHPGVQRAEGIAWASAGLTACVADATVAGVTLCYENHTIGYGWTERDFSLPADIFLEIVQHTEGSGLQLLFDTANNLVNGEEPLPVLEAVYRPHRGGPRRGYGPQRRLRADSCGHRRLAPGRYLPASASARLRRLAECGGG